ncbi:TPA: hypothetical protein ENS27_07550 [bacterium]|nr:hypothetical protein [bacterium]
MSDNSENPFVITKQVEIQKIIHFLSCLNTICHKTLEALTSFRVIPIEKDRHKRDRIHTLYLIKSEQAKTRIQIVFAIYKQLFTINKRICVKN